MGWDSNSHLVLTAPISLADISWACGRGGSGSYNLGDMIKNGTTINKWAKFKPVKSSNPGILSATELAVANYGISIPGAGFGGFTGSSGMIANLASADWVYDKPTAGQPNEWFRALDFDGYRTGATPPIYPLSSSSSTQSSAATINYGMGFGRNIATQTGYITLADLHINGHAITDTFGEYYLGAVAYYSDSIYAASTMSAKYNTIAASNDEIVLSINNIPVPSSGSRTYRIIPFFASVPFTTFPSSSYSGALYPIPFAECALVVSKPASAYISILMGTYYNDSSTIYYQYRITNPTSSSVSGQVNVRMLRSYNINDYYGSALLQESRSVAANTTYTSQVLSWTDGLLVPEYLSNCPYAGVELMNGQVRSYYDISYIYLDLDPADTPWWTPS